MLHSAGPAKVSGGKPTSGWNSRNVTPPLSQSVTSSGGSKKRTSVVQVCASSAVKSTPPSAVWSGSIGATWTVKVEAKPVESVRFVEPGASATPPKPPSTVAAASIEYGFGIGLAGSVGTPLHTGGSAPSVSAMRAPHGTATASTSRIEPRRPLMSPPL